MLICFKYEQKYLSKVSCSTFFPYPIFAVRFCGVVGWGGGGGFCMGVVLVGSGVQQKWSRTLLLWCRSVLLRS